MKFAIFTSVLVLYTSLVSFPQKITDQKIEGTGKRAEMKLDFAEKIRIETWDNNYIGFHATANIDDNRYNDYYNLSMKEKEGKVEIVEKVDFEGIKKVKGEKNLCNFNTEIVYTIKVPKNQNFSINTISGEIELIGCEGEMAVNSVSGFIDYAIPDKLKAKIDLSTVTGDVYSNVKFDNSEPEEIQWVGTKRELTLNGGNKDVELKTVSGDIFLRKL